MGTFVRGYSLYTSTLTNPRVYLGRLLVHRTRLDRLDSSKVKKPAICVCGGGLLSGLYETDGDREVMVK